LTQKYSAPQEMKLKVLFIAGDLTYFTRDLFQELRRQGIKTNFFTLKKPFTFSNKLKSGIGLVRKARRADVIFVDYLSGLAYYSSRFKRLFRRPIFVRCHRTELYDRLAEGDTSKKLSMLRFTVKKVDKILCVSRAIKNRLVSLCPEAEKKSVVVYNGVDVKKYQPISHKTKDPLQIGSLGFLIPRKGFEGLIQAASELIDEGYKLELHIGGKGELKDKLEEKIKNLGKHDHIFLDGFIPEDEICKWYALKDMYIQNSSSEGHCVSILQAMSCGLPVFSTDVGGASETLPQDWVYSVDDPLGLKHKLRWFFELSLKERSRIGKKNREKIEKDFNLTKQTQKIIELFRTPLA